MGCKSMPFAGTGRGKCRFLSVTGEIILETVTENREQFISATKKDASYILNFSDITSCDLAGLQLIYSLMLQLQKDQKEFSIQESSPLVDDLLILSGIKLPDSLSTAADSED